MERVRVYIEAANAAIRLALSATALLVVIALVTVPLKDMENNTVGRLIRNFAILLKIDVEKIKVDTEQGVAASQTFGDATVTAAPNAASAHENRAVAAAIAVLNDATVASAARAQDVGVPAPLSGSGVVFGADKNLAAARHEWSAARRMGLTAALYQRQGFFRSVALVGTADSARRALETLRETYPQRAPYLVDLPTWCPDARKERQENVEITICR